MNQETFVNQYIELLNGTVAEAIQKNIVLQAQKRIKELEFEEAQSTIRNYEDAIKLLKSENDNEVMNLKRQLNDARKDSIHLETFKTELIKLRTEKEELVNKIKELEKVSEEKKQPKDVGNTWIKKTPTKKKSIVKEEIIKDAGKF